MSFASVGFPHISMNRSDVARHWKTLSRYQRKLSDIFCRKQFKLKPKGVWECNSSASTSQYWTGTRKGEQNLWTVLMLVYNVENFLFKKFSSLSYCFHTFAASFSAIQSCCFFVQTKYYVFIKTWRMFFEGTKRDP